MSAFAQTASRFVLSQRFGMLCTTTVEGYPFGSLVPYVVSENRSELIIQVAQIAEHYRNLQRSTRSCLLIADPYGTHNPTRFPRATIFVDWHEADGEGRQSAKKLFSKTVGENIPPEIEPTFSYFVGEIQKIRWIGGFGNVGWLSKEEFCEYQEDEITRCSFDIITHMNCDHAAAVAEIACQIVQKERAYGSRIIGVYEDKMLIRLTDGEDIEYRFSNKCTSAEEFRSELIKLLKTIRNASDES